MTIFFINSESNHAVSDELDTVNERKEQARTNRAALRDETGRAHVMGRM